MSKTQIDIEHVLTIHLIQRIPPSISIQNNNIATNISLKGLIWRFNRDEKNGNRK